MYLLDTNVVSELRRPRPRGAVIDWLRSVPDHALYLSAVTLGELQAGVEITREQDPQTAEDIQAWIDKIAVLHNVLPMDGTAFRLWARLMYGKSDALIEDAMIAATTMAHQMIVVTRNVRDFDPFGVETFNPFKGHPTK